MSSHLAVLGRYSYRGSLCVLGDALQCCGYNRPEHVKNQHEKTLFLSLMSKSTCQCNLGSSSLSGDPGIQLLLSYGSLMSVASLHGSQDFPGHLHHFSLGKKRVHDWTETFFMGHSFRPHDIGQNSVKWPQLIIRKAEKYGLSGRKGNSLVTT